MGYLKGILFFLFMLWIVSACSETDPVVPVEEITEVEKELPEVKWEVLEIGQRSIKLKVLLAGNRNTELTDLRLCYSYRNHIPDTTDRVNLLFPLYKQETGSIDITLEGLKASTEYTCRLYMTNTDVTGYSKPLSFITKKSISETSWEFIMELPGTDYYTPLTWAVKERIFACFPYVSWDGTEGGELFEYDFNIKEWRIREETPWRMRSGLIHQTLGNYTYMGLGEEWHTPEDYPRYSEKMRDWWSYNPETNEWTEKTGIPHEYWNVMACFTYQEYIYVLYSYTLIENNQDPMYVMAYNTKTDEWTRKNDFPGERVQRTGSFVVKNKAYVICGDTHPGYSSNPMGYTANVWEYDLRNDTWEQKADFPGGERSGVIAEASNGIGYAGFGEKYDKILTVYRPIDWWSYSPEEDQWYPCNTYTKWEWSTVGFSFVINDEIYIGSKNDGLWKYIGE